MYESSEANELLDMAVEYNVLPPKKEKKFRRDLQSGEIKPATLVQNLQVRLAGPRMRTPCSLPYTLSALHRVLACPTSYTGALHIQYGTYSMAHTVCRQTRSLYAIQFMRCSGARTGTFRGKIICTKTT
jgi:hypothetical protein